MSLVASVLQAVAYGSSQSLSSDGWISSFITGSSVTHAGTEVNEQVALQVTAVYRAIALISDAVAVLPIDVLQRVGDMRERRSDHPVSALLRRPNPLMNSVDLRCTLQTHALQYGNAYMDVQRNEAGDPIALWPLLPDRTRPVTVKDDEGMSSIVYQTTVGAEVVKIAPADVAHVRGPSFDGIRGYPPLQLARQAVGLALGLEEFGGKFFGNDAKSGGFLSHPGKLGPEARKNLQESMAAQGGLGNAHRMKVLEEGMQFQPMTVTPEDSQFLVSRSFQIEEIARLYGVPLHMLQSQAKTTSWGTGIAQMSLGFLIYTIQPWLLRWEQELEHKLLTEEEIRLGFYLKFNVNALLRADAATRASFYTAALSKATGWLGRDEVRALEDLNPDGIENESAVSSPPIPSGVEVAPPELDDEDDEG